VAIKKISDPFDYRIEREYQLRVMREVMVLLRLRGCANTIQLQSLPIPENINEFKDLYIVTNLLDHDLKAVLSTQQVEANNVRSILYGILLGIKQLHDAQIVHRDMVSSHTFSWLT
jgi:serine/threonine protein kinase